MIVFNTVAHKELDMVSDLSKTTTSLNMSPIEESRLKFVLRMSNIHTY